MRVLPFDVLLDWILKEFEQRQSIFGIHRSLFFVPSPQDRYAIRDFLGQHLATPIGPAAGPHTQLAQNIVSAWLCGGRFIELKTVQVLDELDIPRPCIDMEDEGYNVEWSQELKLDESAGEYIKAWALIHVLHRLLGFEGKVPLGTIFNMSIGYNLEGIRSAPVTRFLERMQDASREMASIEAILMEKFPRFAGIPIPSRISNNVTVSTMHGCPPAEIERIARYLLETRRLHTTVKLNPTLLGKERVLAILHDVLGFREIQIPDAVFEHDLQYAEAVNLVASLRRVAAGHGLDIGVKLSNTLPVHNHKSILPGAEMYMSGRALYPLTINLFHKLATDLNGEVNVSYSGGADALNVCTLLACGARPVTVVSDLLKPGGYGRFAQYLENLEAGMRDCGAGSLEELAREKLSNLGREAAAALADSRYQKRYLSGALPKVDSGLGLFDCVTAPCVERCAVRQDVPEYARLIARGEHDRALEVVLARNPLPGVTGYICTHLCQGCCTRAASNYDEPVSIRALKRFAAERGRAFYCAAGGLNRRVAIIGSGPSALSAACFLALSGIQVTIFEAQNVVGGMMRLAPAFRLPAAVIQEDVDRIARLGVDIRLSHPITGPPEELLQSGFDAVYIATGFQQSAPLHIEGMDAEGVIAALDLLRQVQRGEPVVLGARVLVIGGGNTAMDAARVAQRLTGRRVTVVYRRTRAEMPANPDDIREALEEGIVLQELVSPIRVLRRHGCVIGLECMRNELGEPGADGRRRPVPVEGSVFEIGADSIIVAVGQRPDLAFLDGSTVRLRKEGFLAVDAATGSAGIPSVYAGGDAVRGPASIIAACADGRKAAEAICAEFGVPLNPPPLRTAMLSEIEILQVKRARTRRQARFQAEMIPPDHRPGFDLIEGTLTEDAARNEAARCLQCSVLCDKCVEICPNRANHVYHVLPQRLKVPVLSCRHGVPEVTGESVFQLGQGRQIIHVHDMCNECGNCATFCVHQGKPYQDKPRLFRSAHDFEKEINNAFHIHKNLEGVVIRRREGGSESRLILGGGNDEFVFENDLVRVTFTGEDFHIRAMALRKPFAGDLTLMAPAEMYLIGRGVLSSLAFLL